MSRRPPPPKDADGLDAGDRFLRAIFGTVEEAAAKKAAQDAAEAAQAAEAAAIRAEKLAARAAEEAESAAKKKAIDDAWREKRQAAVAASQWVRRHMRAVATILEADGFIAEYEGDTIAKWKASESSAVKIRAAVAKDLSYQEEMAALADVLAAIINGEFEGVDSPLLKKGFI
jgi:predicted deacylase